MVSFTREEVRSALQLVADIGHLRFPRGCTALVEEAVALAQVWTGNPTIQGFGIAYRRTAGSPTRELALKVYVDRKLPLDTLPVPAPRSVQIPWSRKQIPVDVESIGKIHLQQGLSGIVRPAVPGCAIATPGTTSGSLGCLVRDPVENGALYLLSAAHVIADNGLGPMGLPVLQPGDKVGGDQTVGQLVRWGAFQFTQDTFPNLFDAAVAIVNPSLVAPEIYKIGRPIGFRTVIPQNLQVQKCGAATEWTASEVLDSDFYCFFHYRQRNGTFARAGFRKQVLCRKFSDKGDSGAAVLDMQKRAVGLIIGGADGGTVFSPILPILQRLGVTIA